MMQDRELERARELIAETARLMSKYKEDSEKIIGSMQRELDKSLGEQRKMITEMVREEITQETSASVRNYVKDMEAARSQMIEQVNEFNAYLRMVEAENKKISTRAVWTTSITLAALVIGGIAIFFFYSNTIQQKKVEADMVTRINQADIVRCGDSLCAKTGKPAGNGYRVIQKR